MNFGLSLNSLIFCSITLLWSKGILLLYTPTLNTSLIFLMAELYKHAPYILRMYLLDHYNQCLSSASVPTDWLFSEVVMIVKNYSKDTRLPSNYRPISLTNISYKIFASMLQSRLSHLLDDRIRPTQFGFRKIDPLPSRFIFSAGYWKSTSVSPPLFMLSFLTGLKPLIRLHLRLFALLWNSWVAPLI